MNSLPGSDESAENVFEGGCNVSKGAPKTILLIHERGARSRGFRTELAQFLRRWFGLGEVKGRACSREIDSIIRWLCRGALNPSAEPYPLSRNARGFSRHLARHRSENHIERRQRANNFRCPLARLGLRSLFKDPAAVLTIFNPTFAAPVARHGRGLFGCLLKRQCFESVPVHLSTCSAACARGAEQKEHCRGKPGGKRMGSVAQFTAGAVYSVFPMKQLLFCGCRVH